MYIESLIHIIRSTNGCAGPLGVVWATPDPRDTVYKIHEQLSASNNTADTIVISDSRDVVAQVVYSLLRSVSSVLMYNSVEQMKSILLDDGIVCILDKSCRIPVPVATLIDDALNTPPCVLMNILKSAVYPDEVSWLWLYKQHAKAEKPVDIVIPLGNSTTDNLELRIALRSIDKYASGYNRVVLVTNCPPDWVQHVDIISAEDTHKNNKDANIINKVLASCTQSGISDRIIFWSDDQILNTQYDLMGHLPVYNTRGIDVFKDNPGKWNSRMYNTLCMVRDIHGYYDINWESHVPQPIDSHRFVSIMGELPYTDGAGMCINTAYFGSTYQQPTIPQHIIKHTFEKPLDSRNIPITKTFTGYNDKGFFGGLRESLLAHFNTKSKYER